MEKNDRKVVVRRITDIISYEEIKGATADLLGQTAAGMNLPSGGRVMIKVNLCLLKGPETGATVDPLVAKAAAEWFLENYHVKKIYIAEADATHLGAEMAFRVLGWDTCFKGMREVELFNLSKDETVPVRAKYLSDLRMSKTMMEVNTLVSLAKLKTHTQQKITCIMKNQFGAIPYKYKIVYHPRLAQAIYDAAASRMPDLSIVDGLIAMEGNGPTNGIPRRTKLLLASNDAYSMDHFCARIMGFKPMSIPHLKLASEDGLGGHGYKVSGVRTDTLNLRFKFLPKWKELIKKVIGMMQQGERINEEA